MDISVIYIVHLALMDGRLGVVVVNAYLKVVGYFYISPLKQN